MVDKNTTLAELVAKCPDAAVVLAHHDLEADGRTVAEAAQAAGLCGCELARALDVAAGGLADLWHSRPSQVIDNILATHHQWLRENLPAGAALLAEAKAAAGSPQAISEVDIVHEGLCQELFSHMAKEEQILFPMIRQLESEGRITCGCGHLEGPVTQMEYEHDSAKQALRQLKALRLGLGERAGIDAETARRIDDYLQTLHDDMVTHIYKENQILFPAAEALVPQTT